MSGMVVTFDIEDGIGVIRGLMYWADGIGVREVYNQIAAWHQRFGKRWAPSRLLRRLAETGTPLREAKPG